MRIKSPIAGLAIAAVMAALVVVPSASTRVGDAASHREAPLISLDPAADITDFFMFRSYESGKADKVVLIMNVFPFEEPSAGPNYFHFDPSVLYAFHIDNDMDGKAEDVVIEFRFSTEIRGIIDQLNLFLGYVALPPVTALDGPGSAGLGLRQRYSVTMVRHGHRTQLADGLIAVPSNVGPKTMPNYDALAAQGIHDLGHGIRVFAGQRDDPFYIDLGAVFDTLNLRSPATDMLSGFNVQTIALEVPASMLTMDGKGPGVTEQPKLGAYASTSRHKVTVLRSGRHGEDRDDDNRGRPHARQFVQVQRLANPLINEAIIGTEDKDRWNASEPEDESQFLDYYRNPRLATALQIVIGLAAPATPRDDLVNILLKYDPSDTQLSELLRLNIDVAPRALAAQQRLTVLAGDNAGFPNGRRPRDDVLDVAVQVVGGPNYVAAGAGDNVNANDKTLPASFPFLASPWDGRNRVHVNP